MDKKYIDDNNIKSKYLRGLLTSEEVDQFESHLMDKPELVEELELDDAFFNILPRLEDRRESQRQKNWAFLDIPLRRVIVPVTVCLFAIPLGLFSVLNEPGVSSIQPVFLTNDSFRAATDLSGDIRTLTFRDDREVILLFLDPANQVAESFDVIVRDASGGVVQRFENRSRRDFSYISIELPSTSIDEGGYLVEIRPTRTTAENLDEALESIPFSVVKTD